MKNNNDYKSHIQRLYIISVVRDELIFKKNVANLKDCNSVFVEYLIWHNQSEDKNIITPPAWYNLALQKYRTENTENAKADWLVFIHDDVFFKSNLEQLAEKLYLFSDDGQKVFGLLGAKSDNASRKWFGACRHKKIVNSSDIYAPVIVDTVDSMCLFIRGDLICENSSLQFDERFNLHLYIEDLCLFLKRLNIPVLARSSASHAARGKQA